MFVYVETVRYASGEIWAWSMGFAHGLFTRLSIGHDGVMAFVSLVFELLPAFNRRSYHFGLLWFPRFLANSRSFAISVRIFSTLP